MICPISCPQQSDFEKMRNMGVSLHKPAVDATFKKGKAANGLNGRSILCGGGESMNGFMKKQYLPMIIVAIALGIVMAPFVLNLIAYLALR